MSKKKVLKRTETREPFDPTKLKNIIEAKFYNELNFGDIYKKPKSNIFYKDTIQLEESEYEKMKAQWFKRKNRKAQAGYQV